MIKLFSNLKPMAVMLFFVIILVASQAIAELYLPDKMSDIINDGIYIDYEPMYEYLEMVKPGSIGSMDSTIEGYDDEYIPVFEMQDGFSTVDLRKGLEIVDPTLNVDFEFQDIAVKDSKQLFEEILVPFLDGLDPYQGDKKYEEFSPEDQLKIQFAINRLIKFSTLTDNESRDTFTVDTFLDIKKETGTDEEGDIFQNDTTRKILSACFVMMKHSPDGNVLPIPVDKYGNRLAVDSYGRAIEQDKVIYKYDEETERYSVMPDYELIICNKVLGYAYKYVDGVKWIKNRLGRTEELAQRDADEFNSQYKIKPESEKTFLDKLIEIVKLSPTGKQDKEELARKEGKTYEDFMKPDGVTIQQADIRFILKRGGNMLFLTLFASVCAIIAMQLGSIIVSRFSAKVRSQIFSKVENFSLVEFDKFSTASLNTRSTNDINQIQVIFLLIIRTALAAPVTIIGGTMLSLDKSRAMTAVLLYPLPILFIATAVAMKKVQPLFVVIQKRVDKVTLIMRENLTGVRVVRAFNQQEREKLRFGKENRDLSKVAITVFRYVAILAPLIAVCMNCTMLGIIYTAAKGIDDGTLDDVGSMMAVIQYATLIMLALVMLASVVVMVPRAQASARRINEVLESDIAITDAPGALDRTREEGCVEFKNVFFKYSSDAEKDILSDITFRARKGEVTAIIGGTGSGKSTVINLIPRLYEPYAGTIYVDGQDIKTMPQEDLRNRIGFIPQKSVLFSGTIRSNLLYGNRHASDEELWEALRIAQSENFVKNKEGCLDSVVEQGGRNFSGGQKQRLSIARAIVRKPEIFIFDDSFSALDFKTDKKLRAALKPITKDSAVIIVAQRIGTIMDADNILVLHNGRIAAQGKHDYLVRNCDVYRDIALSQMSKEELGL
jgi:ATP-binding cassette subfamily B multidrug efflux pump